MDLHGDWIGPLISHWIISKKVFCSLVLFAYEGLWLPLPSEQASHGVIN